MIVIFLGMASDFRPSSSSSLGGTSLSRLHEFSPLGTVLRTLPRRVEAEIVLLEVELNRSKPGSFWSVPDMTYNVFGGTLSLTQSINQSSWSTRWAVPVHRQTTDGCS